MPIELKMPALSPTMEEGTLAKWLVKEGDSVQSGDLLAEIETDKATMEFEAIDEGTVAQILVPEGTDNVKVGTIIAIIAVEGEDASSAKAAPATPTTAATAKVEDVKPIASAPVAATPAVISATKGDRVKASPLARRIAEQKGVDLAGLAGSGPGGRIIKADVEGTQAGTAPIAPSAVTAAPSAAPAAAPVASDGAVPAPFADIPHSVEKLSNMRKTIARRLTEAKQTIPHIYLTVDVRLDALLKLRGDLNASLAPRNIKLSVNDMLIKALAVA